MVWHEGKDLAELLVLVALLVLFGIVRDVVVNHAVVGSAVDRGTELGLLCWLFSPLSLEEIARIDPWHDRRWLLHLAAVLEQSGDYDAGASFLRW